MNHMSKKRKRKISVLKQKFTLKMQKKLVMLFMLVLLAFAGLVGRITYINASSGEEYAKVVLDQQQYVSRTIPFKRGDILDTNGTKLATSERVYNIILDAKVLASDKKRSADHIAATKEVLQTCFGIEPSTVDTILVEKPESRYSILKKKVDYDSVQEFYKIEETNDDIRGVWMEEDYVRKYPYNNLACDVLGFSVNGDVGLAGLEASYNDTLNGTDGREYGYQNADLTTTRTVKEAVNGNTIMMTLDANLQSIVEKHLSAFNEEHRNEAQEGAGFKNGAVIMMDPNTGSVLAMASLPDFDLNNPRDLSKYYTEEQLESMSSDEKLELLNSLWRNFCVSDTFEPGSTIKPFTIATGLEMGALTGNESYTCNGSLHVGDYDIQCISYERGGHGIQNLRQVMENSCNVALMEIGMSIGVEEFIRYQHIFGFGEYSGIDLPGDISASSLMFTEDTMRVTELATCAFGQSFNVSMVQLATGFCSLINGGNYYKPRMVRQIQDASGNVVETIEPVLEKKTISTSTCETIKNYMYNVVQNGSGRDAQVEGYDIGGKTGTAEKLPRGENKNVVSFIGYAPQDNPQVVVYVVIDEPNVPEQWRSSGIVSKLAGDIMAEAFPYLNIKKTGEE